MDRVIRQLRIDELKRQLHYEKFCEDSKKSGTVVAVLSISLSALVQPTNAVATMATNIKIIL